MGREGDSGTFLVLLVISSVPPPPPFIRFIYLKSRITESLQSIGL